jgi:DNA-binding protein HU-beta
MKKSELIDRVAEKAEMSKTAAARAVEAIFDTASGAISEAIRAGGHVALPGFGRFRTKTRPARKGRNPQTGAEIDIPERTVVQFSAGKGLNEVLAGGAKGGRGGAAKKSSGAAKKSSAAAKKSSGAANETGGGGAKKSTRK